ncbi:diacylglycerol/lipid kinase family protein [Nesterenkonia sphaerica]|uniref:DAGKc domain-containing protein n=1 Tax=Nesterenkonia sphaerica TaxID=1804988 RepID=A0A5R9A3P5_9MICC|nr:diacylglycerol kinase family protein [Nesterenkonia sphaerica]TLP72814.1 hypothetical protein FEF27_11335 [Nesterenkonia sphaerica]
MTVDYGWIIAAALVLVVVLGIVIIQLARRVRGLKHQVSELEQRAEITAAVAAHPKRPEDRLVGVVVNVSKDNAEQVTTLVHRACAEAGMPEPFVQASTAEDPGRAMAQRAVEHGCDVVIAVGGDGTVRAVASALTGTNVALGIIPLGTGNLFARNIGLPYHDLPACTAEAIHGTAHRVDTLQLELRRPGGRSEQEISLVIAGGGLDAEVMEDTREVLKARAGWLAYGEAGLRHVLGARKTLSVKLDDGEPETYRVRSVLLANCGTLQAGIRLIPEAMFDDGHMDVALFTPRHALDWARVIAKTAFRYSADIPVMKVRQARTGRLTMAEPMRFQIDGDAVGDVISVSARVDHESLVVHGVSPTVLDHPHQGAVQ